MLFLHTHSVDGSDIYINPDYVDSFWIDGEGYVHVSTFGRAEDSVKIKEPLDVFLSMFKVLIAEPPKEVE